MSILFGVVVACSDASVAPPPATAENAGRVVHDHYRLWYRDSDADGHGDPEVTTRGLVRPDGYVANATDCDDQDAAIFRSDDCAISIAEADLSIDIDDEDARLGESMTSADLDADGVADLAIGAYGSGADSAGAVYLLYGPASGSIGATDLVSLSTTTTFAHFGSAVGAGDANADGLDDLLVAAEGDGEFYLFLGPVTADRSASDADAEFVLDDLFPDPPCVDITRDFDGDGGADLVMASPYQGDVYVASGTASGTLALPDEATYTFSGPSGGRLGLAMAETGDTDGDGIADLALAAPYASPGGIVYVVAGGGAPGAYDAADVATATFAAREYGYLGFSVASGDYDGDGTADLFAGAWAATSSAGNTFSGAVYGYLGPLSGSVAVRDASVRWESGAGGTISEVGGAVVLDDLDGDGTQDVAIGSLSDRVFLQFGYASGVVDVSTLVRIDQGSGDARYVTSIPDWTGDGGSELALGVPITDGASTEDAGIVYVFSDSF